MKRLREQQTHGVQLQTGLNRALADQAGSEAQRDALQTAARLNIDELARVREACESLTAVHAKLAAQVDAHQLLLADYRMRLGLIDTPR